MKIFLASAALDDIRWAVSHGLVDGVVTTPGLLSAAGVPPALVQTANSSLATGGPAALALTMIGSPGYAVASSIAAGALSLLKSALDLRAERNKVTRSASNAVAYLSQIRER